MADGFPCGRDFKCFILVTVSLFNFRLDYFNLILLSYLYYGSHRLFHLEQWLISLRGLQSAIVSPKLCVRFLSFRIQIVAF